MKFSEIIHIETEITNFHWMSSGGQGKKEKMQKHTSFKHLSTRKEMFFQIYFQQELEIQTRQRKGKKPNHR